MTTATYSVQTIRDYLLGQLPEADTERLDELSISDGGWADRIRAVEHDLVDAFARGELDGAVLEQFRSRYLTTPRGRAAIAFAEALQSLEERSGIDAPSEVAHASAAFIREKRRWPERLALAAVVVLATGGAWLALDNRSLRARVTSAETARDELQQDQQRRQAEARRPADTPPLSTAAGPSPLTVATLVLSPQLRSARQLPTVALADGAGDLAVRLELEPVDYTSYDASLIASNGGRQVWATERLIARNADGRKTIDLRLPATVLGPQEYLIRVSGVPARGASEIAGEYRFTVVR